MPGAQGCMTGSTKTSSTSWDLTQEVRTILGPFGPCCYFAKAPFFSALRLGVVDQPHYPRELQKFSNRLLLCMFFSVLISIRGLSVTSVSDTEADKNTGAGAVQQPNSMSNP